MRPRAKRPRLKPQQKNNMKKIISLILTVIMISTALISCGDVGYTEKEIKKTAEELVENSTELNEIYFGEGLPITDENSVASALYSPVTEDCKYHSTTEIKAATEKVYTADYCEVLFKRGFEGTSLESETKVVYARFIDDFDGRLTARKDLKETSMTVGRTYDYSTMKVESMKKGEALVSIQSVVENKPDVTVKITLKLESSGWRLDTPTY